ncbi:hypothetical protein V8J88_03870 [Massilia sp. W12]|uniref:hypothetical protein n=1 Tax=Massilia sp. W12 TaxID=3126507 RepID=UPI0030CAD8D2
MQESTYHEGQEVDLTPTEATEHAHKLEPVCNTATKVLAAVHQSQQIQTPAAPAAGGGIDYGQLAAALAPLISAGQAAPAPAPAAAPAIDYAQLAAALAPLVTAGAAAPVAPAAEGGGDKK